MRRGRLLASWHAAADRAASGSRPPSPGRYRGGLESFSDPCRDSQPAGRRSGVGPGVPRTQRSGHGNRQHVGRRGCGSRQRRRHGKRLGRTRRQCAAGGSGHGPAADAEQTLRHRHPSVRRSFHAGCPRVGQAAADHQTDHRRGVFRHESGIHVRGLLADRRTYEPFAAKRVGRRGTEIVLGKHSGTAALRHVLVEEGIHISAAEAADLLTDVRAAAFRAKSLTAPKPTPQNLVGGNREELLDQPTATASL